MFLYMVIIFKYGILITIINVILNISFVINKKYENRKLGLVK